MWWWFAAGLVLGLALAAPLALLATRRVGERARRLAERARAAERLAEQGMLAGGLAHEIKNPLSSIGLNIQLIQEDLRPPPRAAAEATKAAPAPGGQAPPPVGLDAEHLGRVQRRIDALARETHRLRGILEDFLRFAGRMQLDRAPVDVNVLIQELVDFYAPQASQAGIRVRTQLEAAPSLLQADASLLKQALVNLLINATQAMAEARAGPAPHGGAEELIIRTSRVQRQDQAELHLHVIDTGPGIAPDRVERVFQPYFTTKRGGTGLGLPTTRRIVEEHGGTIRIHSEPGKGSDFTVILPITPPGPAAPSAPPAGPDLRA